MTPEPPIPKFDPFRSARWGLWARALLVLAYSGVFLTDGSLARATVTGHLAYLLLVDGALGVTRYFVPPRPHWAAVAPANLLWGASLVAGFVVLWELEVQASAPLVFEVALGALFALSVALYSALAWREPSITRYALVGWGAWMLAALVFLLLVPREAEKQVWLVAPLGVAAFICAVAMIASLVPPPNQR